MDDFGNFDLIGLAAALGIGLLIGLERERRQTTRPQRAPAGLRTFALTAVLGALSLWMGTTAFAVAGIVLGLLVVVGYSRSAATEKDRGLTTEVALILTFLLGALAMQNTVVAVAVGVVVTILLAARSRLHSFVQKTIKPDEMRDGLLLAAAALVILPLTPDRALGPYAVLNPRTLWMLVVLVMTVNAAGYVALRALGPRFGLSFAGLAGGFVSSLATIGVMGARAKQDAKLARGAVSGAVLSSVATSVKMFIIIGATSLAALKIIALPMLLATIAAMLYGAWFAWHAARAKNNDYVARGRAFDPRLALGFAAAIAAVMLIAAALSDWLGNAGLILAASIGGFADAHAPSVAVAAIAKGGSMKPEGVLIPILLAFTTNAVSKIVAAYVAGGHGFALRVVPGVVLTVVAAWAAAPLVRVLGYG